MAPLVADVGDFGEVAPRQFALHADAVLQLARRVDVRIERRDVAEHRRRRGGAGERVRQVAVLDADARHERRQVRLREDDVAFGLVVEEPDAAADDPGPHAACRRR